MSNDRDLKMDLPTDVPTTEQRKERETAPLSSSESRAA